MGYSSPLFSLIDAFMDCLLECIPSAFTPYPSGSAMIMFLLGYALRKPGFFLLLKNPVIIPYNVLLVGCCFSKMVCISLSSS